MTKQKVVLEVLVIVAAVLLGLGLIDLASHIVIWLLKVVYRGVRRICVPPEARADKSQVGWSILAAWPSG